MRNLLLAIIAIFFSVTTYAQGVRVTVTSGGEPLKDAYLFINSKYFSSSDPNGEVTIPSSSISTGDTIRVSFVGMDKVAVVYNPATYKPEGITVNLIPNLSLGGVVVSARSKVQEKFLRTVNRRYATYWHQEYAGAYTIIPTGEDRVMGLFNLFGTVQKYSMGKKLERLYLVPIGDMGWEKEDIDLLIDKSFQVSGIAAQIPALLKNSLSKRGDVKITLLGKNKNHFVFLLVKPMVGGEAKDEVHFQAMIYVNEHSGDIEQSDVVALLPGASITSSIHYAIYKNSKVQYALHPKDITTEFILSDDNTAGNKVVVKLEHITIHEKPKEEKTAKK